MTLTYISMVTLTVEILKDIVVHLPIKSVIVFTFNLFLYYIPVIQVFIVYKMEPKKIQSPLVAQRAEQKQVAKVSWKETARA